jgi:cell volume regulation protein A
VESSISIEVAKYVLLSCGIILAAGAFSGFLSQKLRVPDIVLFLIAGIILGPEITGIINIKADSALNQIILIFGACYILFDGGASLRFRVLKEVWITIIIIATVGVAITASITGIAAYYILKTPFIIALLLGATIASTDPATLVPIFKQIRIKDRVAQTIISESAFNDAMGAIVTFSVLAIATGSGEFSVSQSLIEMLRQSVIGILVGSILGYLAALFIAHEKLSFLSEYAPIITIIAVVASYLVADGFQASSFMAVFVFGIVLGNKDSFGFQMENGEDKKLEEYIITTSLIMRMFIFILLGTQVDFNLIRTYLSSGIAIVLIFMFIARPVTVFACAIPDRRARWTRNEMLLMCWTRETGVIPAALAGLLIGMKVPAASMIASITFIAILMTIIIQATTTKWLAKKLGLLLED